MKDIVKRSLTGFVYIAIVIAGSVIHPILFAIVFSGFLLITLYEFYRLSESLGFIPQKITGLISGEIIFILFFLIADKIISQQFIYLIILIPLVALLSGLFEKKNENLKSSLVTLGGIVYVALPFGLLNFMVIPGVSDNSRFYPWILIGIFLIIWMYDSMAYLTGSLLGKHKIWPRISPAKSWEGLVGGTVFAVIMGILNAVLFPALSLTNWIIIALLSVIFGTCGDFFESKLKRQTGVKDSGNILPGHGGFLDRFDSLLFVIPAIFVWLNLFGNI